MANLYLLIAIDGERVVIPASEVESVVEIEALTPVPGAASHILGLSALRSRVLTVVDCHASLGLTAGETPRRDAMVVNVGGHPYALLVDRVEDVVETSEQIMPASTVLRPGWAQVARGVVEVGGEMFLLIDPASLVDGPVRAAA